MSKKLLLDFGGVVLKTPFEMTPRLASADWPGPFDTDNDALWRAFQSAEITEREYWHTRATEAFPDADDPTTDLMDVLFAPPPDDVLRPQVMRLVGSYGAAVLTNDLGRFHPDPWLDTMGLRDTFTPLIDLSFHRVLKPAPEAYDWALRQLELSASDVLFVDDQPANIKGAERLGIESIWFDVTQPDAATALIRERLDR